MKIMSRLLHPWAAIVPGDTHAVIADDSDCLLMAAMAAMRHQQHVFVLAEPQTGRSIVFGPDGIARGTEKEGLKPLPKAQAVPQQGPAAAAPGGSSAALDSALLVFSSALPNSASSSSSSSLSSAWSAGRDVSGAPRREGSVGGTLESGASEGTAGAGGVLAAEAPGTSARPGVMQQSVKWATRLAPYNCFSVDALRELWCHELPFLSSGVAEV